MDNPGSIPNPDDAGRLLRETRRRSGLTQRALARRAGTAQSVVARIERGQTSPGISTLDRLLGAAGFALRLEAVPEPASRSHMLADVPRILRLSPEDRLREVAAIGRLLTAVRRAS